MDAKLSSLQLTKGRMARKKEVMSLMKHEHVPLLHSFLTLLFFPVALPWIILLILLYYSPCCIITTL